MSDGIFYNQEVTADDINGIAHDIGHTTFNAVSNDKFGADELNRITADLVTSGILRTAEECKPILSNGSVSVATGVIVFKDGAKIRLESAVALTANAGDEIYAKEDITSGRAQICVAAQLPQNSDIYVRIARVENDGSLTDLRKFCQSRGTWNCTSTQTVSLDMVNGETYTVTPSFGGWELLKVEKVGDVMAGVYDRCTNTSFGKYKYRREGRLEYRQYNEYQISVDSDGTITIRHSGDTSGVTPTVLTICGGTVDNSDSTATPEIPDNIEEVPID